MHGSLPLYDNEGWMLSKKNAEANREKHGVIFYTKPGCHLCDEAREVLHNVGGRFSLDVKEIDINSDVGVFEKYKNIIPVVIIDGKYTFGARVSEDDIISTLQEL